MLVVAGAPRADRRAKHEIAEEQPEQVVVARLLEHLPVPAVVHHEARPHEGQRQEQRVEQLQPEVVDHEQERDAGGQHQDYF